MNYKEVSIGIFKCGFFFKKHKGEQSFLNLNIEFECATCIGYTAMYTGGNKTHRIKYKTKYVHIMRPLIIKPKTGKVSNMITKSPSLVCPSQDSTVSSGIVEKFGEPGEEQE